MQETHIVSMFTSEVVPQGFADVVDVADRLVGTEVSAGKARLRVGERIGDGMAGAVWYEGVLHTGSALVPTVKVDLVVSPWSNGRTEIGLRPLSRLGRSESMRTRRFLDAAWTVIPELAERTAVPASPVAIPSRDLQAA